MTDPTDLHIVRAALRKQTMVYAFSLVALALGLSLGLLLGFNLGRAAGASVQDILKDPKVHELHIYRLGD